MKYKDIPGFGEYAETHGNKTAQMIRLDSDGRPLVLFLDGKGMTRKHDRDMARLSRTVMAEAKKLVKGYGGKCLMFAAMDELTMIFTDPVSAGTYFGEDTETSLLSLIASRLSVTVTAEEGQESMFRGVAYHTTDPAKETGLRKLAGYATAMEYYAKEHFAPDDYRDKGFEDMEKMIKDAGLWDDFAGESSYAHGIYHEHKGLKRAASVEYLPAGSVGRRSGT